MKTTWMNKALASFFAMLLLVLAAGCEPAASTNEGGNDAVPGQGDHTPRPSIDINVGGEDGLDINIEGNKVDPEAGAIDVEVGGGKGVQVDVQPKTEPE
ncbi:MAG: hypothetical protein O3C40_25730 [Planctomycetota bacterium]|nr:hypothetical protein [Planctomycetota bacterium]